MAPLPPDLDLGLTEPPRAVAPAAPVVVPEPAMRPEPPAAAPVGAAPPPAMPTPPSRQSFGLPPLPGRAPVVGAAVAGVAAGAAAGAIATGLAAGARAELPAETRATDAPAADTAEAEKPAAPEVPPVNLAVPEPVVLEPVKVEPIVPAIVVPEPDLAHAVEDLRDEVKAAEADLAPSPEAAAETPDHMASLERILLGAAAAGRTPVTPEPEPLVLPPHREPEPVEEDEPEEAPAQAEPAGEDDKAGAGSDGALPQEAQAEIVTDDFMERLRETLSRPVAPPEPAPFAERVPVAADETVHPPAPSPVLSIEQELERALQASLAPPPPAPPAPAALAPEPRVAEAPPVPVREPRPADGMAALAKDFPELNDLLAPKKPAADPADSLLEDLKDIFAEPKAAPARQEPVVAAPPPPPPAPPAPPLLREGVIAGIPFRLYGDGTIEADIAEGTTRFASLKDFRAHVGG